MWPEPENCPVEAATQDHPVDAGTQDCSVVADTQDCPVVVRAKTRDCLIDAETHNLGQPSLGQNLKPLSRYQDSGLRDRTRDLGLPSLVQNPRSRTTQLELVPGTAQLSLGPRTARSEPMTEIQDCPVGAMTRDLGLSDLSQNPKSSGRG